MDAHTIYAFTAINIVIFACNFVIYFSMNKYSLQRLNRMTEIKQEMNESNRRVTEANDKFIKAVNEAQAVFISQIVTACRSSKATMHVNFVVQGFQQASIVTEKPPEALD